MFVFCFYCLLFFLFCFYGVGGGNGMQVGSKSTFNTEASIFEQVKIFILSHHPSRQPLFIMSTNQLPPATDVLPRCALFSRQVVCI